MKKLIIAAVLMIGMTSFAQEKQEKPAGEKRHKMERLSPEERNEKQLKKMTADLNLSASQQAEIAKILAEEPANNVAEKRARSQQEIDQKRNERKNEMKAKEAKIKAVLTADQLKKHDELKEKRRQEMAEKHQERKEAKEKK